MKTTYTFTKFIRAIDSELEANLGCSTGDLADYPYHEDWETCQDDLAFIAPEDEAHLKITFDKHVGYTVQDVLNECDMDANPHSMPY